MSLQFHPLSFITQKVIHPKTDHVFLMYSTVEPGEDEDQVDQRCSISLTLCSGPGIAGEDLQRWWVGHWSKDELVGLAQPSEIATKINEGLLHVKGWSSSKLGRRDVPLHLVIDPTGSKPVSFPLNEYDIHDTRIASQRLLTMITEQAQTRKGYLFADTAPDEELAKALSEVARLSKQLAKRELRISVLEAELEINKEALKEYVAEKQSSRRARSPLKIPANHSKASVTKKRRLVQKAEFVD